MRTALATLSATLLVVSLLAGCEKRDTTAGGGATPAMPPASAASR
jgi:hypothetical protein